MGVDRGSDQRTLLNASAANFPHYPGLDPDDRGYPQAPFGWDWLYLKPSLVLVRGYVVNSYSRHSGLCVAVRVSSDYPSVGPTSI